MTILTEETVKVFEKVTVWILIWSIIAVLIKVFFWVRECRLLTRENRLMLAENRLHTKAHGLSLAVMEGRQIEDHAVIQQAAKEVKGAAVEVKNAANTVKQVTEEVKKTSDSHSG